MGGAGGRATVLVVDDEPGICRALGRFLDSEGYEALTAASAEEAIRILESADPALAFVDLRLPGMDGLALLNRIRSMRPSMNTVLITAFGGPSAAIHATQAGAIAYLAKPFDLEEVGKIVHRALDDQAPAVTPAAEGGDRPWDPVLDGRSAAVRRLTGQVRECARGPSPVLLLGEPGTGREAVARAIHQWSDAPAESLRVTWCSALRTGEPDGMPATERTGSPGIRLLIEIGDLGEARARALIEGTAPIEGAARPRVIATCRPGKGGDPGLSETLIGEARRLGWAVLPVPPLRERREDIASMVSILLARLNTSLERPVRGLDSGALAVLEDHNWPGNIRELENVVEAAALLTVQGIIGASSLPSTIRAGVSGFDRGAPGGDPSAAPQTTGGRSR